MRQLVKKRAMGLLVLGGLFTFQSPAEAKMSLAVRFPDVVLENVSPGLVLNMRQAKGVPYVVINNSDEALDILLEPELPSAQRIEPKEGYLAAPDAGWITMVPNRFRLAPGEVGTAEVILSVPNDPQHVGKHYQINLRSRTLGTGQLALAVNNYVRFSVGSMGPAALAKEKNRVTLGRLDMDMTPTIRLDNVPLGRPLALKAFAGASIKITNRNDAPLVLMLKSEKIQNSYKEAGWEVPVEGWLTLKPPKLKIKANQIKEALLTLTIPDVPENKGQSYMFLVTAELAGVGIPVQYYTRVYVKTE